jgi:hypothetical protein
VIATKSGVAVTNSEVIVSDVPCALAIPTVAQKRIHTLTWEVSFDGQQWSGCGATSHVVYWIRREPYTNHRYDFALEKAFGYLSKENPSNSTQSHSTFEATGAICRGIFSDLVYDPSAPAITDALFAYHIVGGVQCDTYVTLMQILMLTIGYLPEEPTFVWGGSSHDRRDEYNWTHPVTGGISEASFQCARPAHPRAAPFVIANPHFIYHVVIKADGQYFDPTYGETNIASFLRFAPADIDLAPLGNFYSQEDSDWNQNRFLDIPKKQEGTFMLYDNAAKKFYTDP